MSDVCGGDGGRDVDGVGVCRADVVCGGGGLLGVFGLGGVWNLS